MTEWICPFDAQHDPALADVDAAKRDRIGKSSAADIATPRTALASARTAEAKALAANKTAASRYQAAVALYRTRLIAENAAKAAVAAARKTPSKADDVAAAKKLAAATSVRISAAKTAELRLAEQRATAAPLAAARTNAVKAAAKFEAAVTARVAKTTFWVCKPTVRVGNPDKPDAVLVTVTNAISPVVRFQLVTSVPATTPAPCSRLDWDSFDGPAFSCDITGWAPAARNGQVNLQPYVLLGPPSVENPGAPLLLTASEPMQLPCQPGRLAGCVFTAKSLGEFVFAGENLAGASFRRLTIPGTVSFENANLTGASFRDATFEPGVSLAGAQLAGATLAGVASSGIVGVPASLPDGFTLRDGTLFGPSARFDGQDLTGRDMSNLTLSGASFQSAVLDGASLENSDLTSASLANASLAGVMLDGTRLGTTAMSGMKSSGLVGVPASLPAGFVLRDGNLYGPLTNFAGRDLRGLDLSNLTLSGASFQSAVLEGVDLSNSSLEGADLSNSTLSGRLDATNLYHALLAGVASSNIVGNPLSLPSTFTLRDGNLYGPLTNFAGRDLRGLDMSNLTLYGARFQSAVLDGASLENSVLASANLQSARLVGVNVTGTELADVLLDDTELRGLVGTPASLPAGSILRSGNLYGPGTTYAHQDLSGYDLSGLSLAGTSFAYARLVGVNVDGASFDGADLSGVVSSGIIGIPASLPAGWTLRDGTLFGPGK